jgi:futalosine hydrolase
MMRGLIVAATHQEIEPFLKRISATSFKGQSKFSVTWQNLDLDFLIVGVGMVAMSASLSRHLVLEKYDFLLNAGIAGSFLKGPSIGSVVLVGVEIFGDLGVENGDESFSDLFDLGLAQSHQYPFSDRLLNCNYNDPGQFNLPVVTGLTVNRVHGSPYSINKIYQKYRPDIETMEGAAFFYVALFANIPFLQIRAISNVVEKRNRAAWRIEEALENLSIEMVAVLHQIILSASS